MMRITAVVIWCYFLVEHANDGLLLWQIGEFDELC